LIGNSQAFFGFIAGFLILLSGCAPTLHTHGYVPVQSDLDLILVGADSKASVEETIGRAADTGTFENLNLIPMIRLWRSMNTGWKMAA